MVNLVPDSIQVHTGSIEPSITFQIEDGEEKNFVDRLNKAYETIKEMEQDLRNGDWGNVVVKLHNIE